MGPTTEPDTGPILQPMLHVTSMPQAVSFFQALGGTVREGSPDGDWVLIAVGGGRLGLLAHPPNPDQDEGLVELNFESTGGLEDLEARATRAGIDVAGRPTDTGFGRQLQLRLPGGLLVKINEMDRSTYG